jgi:hypothetical protein
LYIEKVQHPLDKALELKNVARNAYYEYLESRYEFILEETKHPDYIINSQDLTFMYLKYKRLYMFNTEEITIPEYDFDENKHYLVVDTHDNSDLFPALKDPREFFTKRDYIDDMSLIFGEHFNEGALSELLDEEMKDAHNGHIPISEEGLYEDELSIAHRFKEKIQKA